MKKYPASFEVSLKIFNFLGTILYKDFVPGRDYAVDISNDGDDSPNVSVTYMIDGESRSRPISSDWVMETVEVENNPLYLQFQEVFLEEQEEAIMEAISVEPTAKAA